MYQIRGPLGYITGPYLDLRGLLLRGGRKGEERGKAERDTGKGRQAKKNGDSPPTIFGLKVALPIPFQYFAKICPSRGLALRCRL